MEVEEEEEETSKVNLANAVHLSDSEEEEEMEDIIDDFALNMSMDTVRTRHSHLMAYIDVRYRTTIYNKSDYTSSNFPILYLPFCQSQQDVRKNLLWLRLPRDRLHHQKQKTASPRILLPQNPKASHPQSPLKSMVW